MSADLFLYLRKVSGKNGIESRIICFQFFTGVNFIMFAVAIIRIDLGVHVKPVLDSFRPIFPDVCGGIDIFPATFSYGCIQRRLQFVVELRMDRENAGSMYGVGELVDQDIFRMVFVDLIGKDVLLGTG